MEIEPQKPCTQLYRSNKPCICVPFCPAQVWEKLTNYMEIEPQKLCTQLQPEPFKTNPCLCPFLPCTGVGEADQLHGD
jgi:hypothetical protein